MRAKTPVSVVIPAYNGKHLFEENLPFVISELSRLDELVIIDDASLDKTLDYFNKKFRLTVEAKAEDKNGEYELLEGKLSSGAKIKLIINQKNLRFAASCNRAVSEARNPLILLLNTDVKLEPGTLEKLRTQFNDSDLFAVGCFETEPTSKQIGGKNKLWFAQGLFQHSRASSFESGETAWASGGSAMFCKDKWDKLGGFDEKFAPAYWEDIDLSQRARKNGWKILFNKQAKVIHDHESTNKTAFDQQKLLKVSWRNADRFAWKHTNLVQKIQYILFRPFWWWKRLRMIEGGVYKFGLLIILLAAAGLRFYRLAQVPAGMTWDEAAIGYNGYAVIKTRHDEWLERLPVSFKSFGDFKAPLAIYMTGVVTSIFGLNLLVLRIPFAIGGVLAVWGMVLLTKNLLHAHYRIQNYEKTRAANQIEALSLLAGAILALSPWHLHFSRVGFESGLALTFMIWACYFLTIFLFSQKRKNSIQVLMALSSSLLFSLSLYTYHSSKIFTPLFVLSLLLVHLRLIKRKLLPALGSMMLGIIVLLPLAYDSLYGEGLARGGTLIFSQGLGIINLIREISRGFLVHLSPAFLIGGLTDTLRHGTKHFSVFLLVVYILMVVGVFSLILSLFKKKGVNNIIWLKICILWIFLGILPAALGDQQPQSNRALLALPGFIWLATAGFDFLQAVFRKYLSLFQTKVVVAILFTAFLINFGMYLNHYYTDFANNSAEAYNEGYIEAMELAYQYERGVDGKPEVEQIIFSNQYGQAYIYALFVRKTNPIWYQGGSLVKYKFLSDITEGHLQEPNSLIILTTMDEVSVDRTPDEEITAQDGNWRFRVYYNPELN